MIWIKRVMVKAGEIISRHPEVAVEKVAERTLRLTLSLLLLLLID